MNLAKWRGLRRMLQLLGPVSPGLEQTHFDGYEGRAERIVANRPVPGGDYVSGEYHQIFDLGGYRTIVWEGQDFLSRFLR